MDTPAPAAAQAGQNSAAEAGTSGNMEPARMQPPPEAGAPTPANMMTARAAEQAADPGVPPEVTTYASDWPLPNVDYDNTRAANTRIDSHNIAQLREAWRFTLSIDSAAFGYMASNPLVLGGRVYFQDLQSNVYVLERGTGKVVWTRRFDQPSFGPNGVAIGWGKLFVPLGDSSLTALDLEHGDDVWSEALELGQSLGIDIQPVVYAGQLLAATVPVSQSRGIYEAGAHGVLLALDAQTGKRRWSFDTVATAADGGGGAWYPPLIDPQRGQTYWGTGNATPWPDASARPGPNLYTSSLVALSLSDGTLAWHYQDKPHDTFDWDFQNTPLRVRPAAMSGADLVIGAGKTGAVVALDAQTGKLVWRTKVGKHMNDELSEFKQSIMIFPGVLGGVMSPLAYTDGVVYAPSVDLGMSYDGALLVPGVTGGTGNLTAIDVRDGKVLWSATTSAACYGAATIANDLVLTSDENGRVYAFARTSGEEVWHYDAPGGINAPLVIAGDELLVSVGLNTGMVLSLSLNGAGTTAPPSAGAGGMPAEDPPGEPTFTAVFHDIVQGAGCIGGPTCHASSTAGGLKMSTQAEAYTALVGVKAMGTDCSNTGLLRVAPSDPANSLLMHKLQDATPICGQRMPPGGALRQPRIEQLRMWIQAGAQNN